ncbi:hypothetical protein UPYG_G00235820 [Umbra pygmaea]|uniref:snRNA-activating protein complex subunit 2 n=1 Tax=Umbra pygmaea TaxID=75934 RepID=A0ABD0WEA5_UMBPY
MKPPSRTREKPSRYRPTTEKTVRTRKPKFACTGWSLNEQQVLLRCLNNQSKITAGIHGPIDVDALHIHLPKHSKEEIKSQLEFLMMTVLRSVVFQVNRQRSEQKKAMKPIQLWAELAENMAGSLEEPITAAFAQMLVISATEPGSLTNSDPPRKDYLAKQHPSQLKATPARPVPNPISIKAPNSHITPQPGPQAGADTSNLASTRQASQSALTKSPAVASLSVQQQQIPPVTPGSSSMPAAGDVSTEGKQTAAVGLSSTMPHHQHARVGPRTSKYADANTPRNTGLGCIVDLEKIYRFLSAVHIKSECFKLTPMESAVILDLLMSLPEELPLLDCARLQQHMFQVHQQFSAPVHKNVRESTGRTQPRAAEGMNIGHQRGQGPTDGKEPPVEKMPKRCPDGLGSNGMESASVNHNADASTMLSGNTVTRCSNSITPAQGSGHERAGSNTLVSSQDTGTSLGQTPPTKDTLSHSGTTDWENAGLCPLNPFMVPLRLLARRNVKPVDEVALL